MSEWRARVPHVEWRYIKRFHPIDGNVQYVLEAKTFSDDWDKFGVIDMDCAGEGHGETVAEQIVNDHNGRFERKAASEDLRQAAYALFGVEKKEEQYARQHRDD